ncbi:MAG: DEAD/DEAH box helicase [Nitrospirae bacterium]|nr:DEAD/DEAH box helicase [Nitrospirota bacterium]
MEREPGKGNGHARRDTPRESNPRRFEIGAFLSLFAGRRPRVSARLAHHEILPPRDGRIAGSQRLAPETATALRHLGIEGLYEHQADALAASREGRNVVVATPTGSGKTLIYNLAALEISHRDPEARALYLFPLKALAQDQLRTLTRLTAALTGGGDLRAAIYDGDTPDAERRKLRKSPPHILISNPDMLHVGLLPFHDRWVEFFRRLKLVVVDELHAYRGIFGSHALQLFRRLRRVAHHYGSDPRFVATSATIHNPSELAEALTGVPFEMIDRATSPAPRRHFLVLDPISSYLTVSVDLLIASIELGLKTIVFTPARKLTELIYQWAARDRPALRNRISAYRAGFLPEERREIEQGLAEGSLDGVVSTSALEMGIDIGGLDCCILVGYPGTLTATFQRGGRVGRTDREAVIALVSGQDALDQFFVNHPDRLFTMAFERAHVDPANPYIAESHVACAAAELPLAANDPFLSGPAFRGALDRLQERGELLRQVQTGLWVSNRRLPHRGVGLRSIGETYTISETDRHEVIGTMGAIRAKAEAHPGAIYLHRGATYEVTRLDLENHRIEVREADVPYYTMARAEKDTGILSRDRARPSGNCVLRAGRLRVTTRIIAYEKRRTANRSLLSTHELDLPPDIMETMGTWIEVEPAIREAAREAGLHYMGGLHGIEHALKAVFPLYILCEPFDLGGICLPEHPEIGKGAIFVYDNVPGGIGLAEKAYDVMDEALAATLQLVADCPCDDGCPACIHSGRCGAGNYPLDKAASIRILRMLTNTDPIPVAARAETPEPRFAPEPAAAARPAAPRILYFDLETQRTAEEVGGWDNAQLMRLSIGITWDSSTGEFGVYDERHVEDLLAALKAADLVIGFNNHGFDYRVLGAYTGLDLRDAIHSFDMLEDLKGRLGHRVSLDHLLRVNLGHGKSADGLQAVAWWKEGRRDEVVSYCKDDVAGTRDLFLLGAREGRVRIQRERLGEVEVAVNWGEVLSATSAGTRPASDKRPLPVVR